MSPKAAVLTDTIDGMTFDLYLTSAGKFYTTFLGERVEAPSKVALHDKLRKLVRTRAKIAIPASLVESHYDEPAIVITDIVIVGAHGRTRDVVYHEASDPPSDTQTHRYGNIYRRLTPAERAEGQACWSALKAAEKAWEAWQETHQMDAGEALREAQEHVLQEQASQERAENPRE